MQGLLPGEDVQLRCGASHKKKDGVLILTNFRFLWYSNVQTEGAGFRPVVDIRLETIKGHMLAGAESKPLIKILTESADPSSKGPIFTFTHPTQGMSDRQACSDYLTQVLTRTEANEAAQKRQVAAAPAAPPSAPTTKSRSAAVTMLNPAVQSRLALLASHPELNQAYTELVRSGIISEEEFWQSRQQMIASESARTAGSTVGFSSSLLSEGHIETQNNRTLITLTAANIQQIFLEHPAVYSAYRDKVPHELTEEKFWSMYFKSQYLNRNKSTTTASLTGKEDEDMFVQYAKRVEANSLPAKLAGVVNPAYDLSTSDELSAGFGLKIRESTEGTEARDASIKHASESGEPLPENNMTEKISKFNRHSELVLLGKRGRALQTVDVNVYKDAIQKDLIMDDLDAAPPPAVVPLQIQDQRRYFGDGSVLKKRQVVSSDQFAIFDRSITSLTLKKEVVSHRTAAFVMSDITQTLSQSEDGTTLRVKEIETPASVKGDIKVIAIRINELLRHFWACYPAVTPQLEQKAERLMRSIEEQYRPLGQLTATNGPLSAQHNPFQVDLSAIQREHIVKMMNPIFEQYEKAKQMFDSERIRRNQLKAQTSTSSISAST
eukprot:GILJ01010777.1.p1 GENE.GILJ01010777.1~~GILJ01010777.1.p1  ORF type:complete len:607 (+),score=103.59 GILJ01010777.1:1383-3203(+)